MTGWLASWLLLLFFNIINCCCCCFHQPPLLILLNSRGSSSISSPTIQPAIQPIQFAKLLNDLSLILLHKAKATASPNSASQLENLLIRFISSIPALPCQQATQLNRVFIIIIHLFSERYYSSCVKLMLPTLHYTLLAMYSSAALCLSIV